MGTPQFQLTRSPGRGRLGRPTKVRTNFFEVITLPTNIVHFDVAITPEVPPRLNRRIFDRFVDEYRDSDLGSTRPVYDGMRHKKNFFRVMELSNA